MINKKKDEHITEGIKEWDNRHFSYFTSEQHRYLEKEFYLHFPHYWAEMDTWNWPKINEHNSQFTIKEVNKN